MHAQQPSGPEASGPAVGIAVPGHVSGFDSVMLPEWGHAIEEAGFTTIAVSDRPSWWTPEPMTSLAAVAAVTSRVRLLTSILLGPPRGHPGLFATAAATVDALAGPGRLTLGLAPGARPDDYAGSEVDFARRGPAFDTWINDVRSTWAGTAGTHLGPTPVTPGGPPLLFGGSSAPAVRRCSQFGAGWIGGGTDPATFGAFAARVRDGFDAAGRPEQPRLVVMAYVSLGPDGDGVGLDSIRSYYADMGEEFVHHALENTATTPESVRALIADYAQVGADEIILAVSHPRPETVESVRGALDGLNVLHGSGSHGSSAVPALRSTENVGRL